MNTDLKLEYNEGPWAGRSCGWTNEVDRKWTAGGPELVRFGPLLGRPQFGPLPVHFGPLRSTSVHFSDLPRWRSRENFPSPAVT